MGKAETYLSAQVLKGRFVALPINVRPRWEGLSRVNTLAYLSSSKKYLKLSLATNVIKLFPSIIY